MENSQPSSAGTAQSPADFRTTHWTLVLKAGRQESSSADEALASLCRAYWYPLYAFVRRRGYDPAEAQDLTQEFFARLIEKRSLTVVERGRGQFRSFLLAALAHFLDNEWDKSQAVKRGGGCSIVSLDEQDAEDRYVHEPFHELTAEKLYERRWAITLLDRVVAALKSEFTASGEAAVFDALHAYLTETKATESYKDLAPKLGLTEGALRVKAHRMRRRFGELLRAEIAHTVSQPEEIDEEIRHLYAVLG